jgi:signal transduction histidine kinase
MKENLVYENKAGFKGLLFVIALLIGLFTLIYTELLVRKIAREEENKVRIWADAIANKARLVRYTNDLFRKLAAEERQKADVWARSTQLILQVDGNDLLNFFSDIITSNHEIPVLLLDAENKVIDIRNYPQAEYLRGKQAEREFIQSFTPYAPILIKANGQVNYIYYRDSNLFTELKETLNELISTFINEVVLNSASAPVILTNESLEVLAFGKLDSSLIADEYSRMELISNMKAAHEPIEIDLGEGERKLIFYNDSDLLSQIRLFPLIQLALFALFLIISYLAFSASKREEQNRVWIGMAKETAHQLGTPISSLSAWVEYLRERPGTDQQVVGEIDRDVNKLTLVAERFSKIGSHPDLGSENLYQVLHDAIDYMGKRASSKVQFRLEGEKNIQVKINRQLFDWVLENLLKNALDAVYGQGEISILFDVSGKFAVIDITDSGKGISRAQFKRVFEPGFSTKKRGWGLGLSLARRIVEDYHRGEIFVKQSLPGKGTTFRMKIPIV